MKSFNQFLFERELTSSEAASILGLSLSDVGDKDKLKRAYRSASMKAHPDRGGSNEDMQKVNAAYNKLKDATGGSSSTFADMKAQQAKSQEENEEAKQVFTKFSSQFDTEAYLDHLEAIFGVEMTTIEKMDLGRYSATMSVEFSSDDREIVVGLDFLYSYVNYRRAKGSLGTGEDKLTGDITIITDIVYKRNYIKLGRRNVEFEKYDDVFSNPERVLPEKKLKTKIKKIDAESGDEVKWIKKADFIRTLKNNLRYGKFVNNDTYQLKFGEGYTMQLSRVTMMRKGMWIPALFKNGRRATNSSMTSIPETNVGLDLVLKILNDINRASDPERVFDQYTKEWKSKEKYSELYPE